MTHSSPTFRIRHLVAALAAATAVAAPAGADFQFFHAGHTYLGMTTPRNWADAAANAVSREFAGAIGALVRIDDQAENDAIIAALLANIPSGDFSNTAAPDGGGGAYVWIGATDRATEGTWLWDGDGDNVGDQFWQGDQNGAPVDGLYNNWGRTTAQNEPDNFLGRQHAAGISLNGWPLGSAGQWNDVNQGDSLYYLVEFNAIPEPASATLAGIGLLAVTRRHRRRATRPLISPAGRTPR